jgi:EXPERA (EXPanded EBP superfamily)
LRLIPVVVHQYDMLDARFRSGHTVPWMIGMVELLVMYPLCLLTVYAILTRSPYRFPLELLTSAVHFLGMVLFVGAELYEEQVHVPALDPVGAPGRSFANVKVFDLYHLTYYWFGFWFCNLLWGVVPYFRIHRAVCECHRAFVRQSESVSAAAAQTKQQ